MSAQSGVFAFSFNWININSTVIIMPLFAKVLDQKLPSHYTRQCSNFKIQLSKKLNVQSLYLTKKNDWILMISHLFYFKFQNPLVGRWPKWSNSFKKGRWPWSVNHALYLSLILLFIDQYLFFLWVELSSLPIECSDYCDGFIVKLHALSQRCSSEEAMSPSRR